MNYSTTIDFLYKQLPVYQKIGKSAFKKDLTNIKKLCSFLNQPQNQFKSIHIAGTNGKGSCAHLLASIFQEAGYKTGLYTSPHLIDFRERIKINGQPITKNSVINFVKKVDESIESIQPSFFEITVAMAFQYFANQKVDIAIIETGLGGRLDSTNIIQPELSIITNISLEHQQFLGNTLTAIAGEKAGIIKKETPVIIGEKHSETINVFKNKSKQEKADIYFAEEDFKLINSKITKHFLEVDFQLNPTTKNIKIQSGLKAKYQIKNIQTIISAVQIINSKTSFKISKSQLQKGCKNVIKNTNFWGRWQQIEDQPSIILDCAHNIAGIEGLKTHLLDEKYNQLHIIYGCVKDKDVNEIAAILPKKAQYYITQPSIERARSFNETKSIFIKNELQVKYADKSAESCLKEAKKIADKDDLIIITGSIFLVAEFVKNGK